MKSYLSSVNVLYETAECFRLDVRHADGYRLPTDRWSYGTSRDAADLTALRILEAFASETTKISVALEVFYHYLSLMYLHKHSEQ